MQLDKSTAELSEEGSVDEKCAWPATSEGREQHEQSHLNPLTLDREGGRAVFPLPLGQNAQVFGVQHVLSPNAATNVMVFVHLLVDVLRR